MLVEGDLNTPEARNPFALLSREQILLELAMARQCAEKGENQDFEEAVDEICRKYGL